jgi:hypothetical protein
LNVALRRRKSQKLDLRDFVGDEFRAFPLKAPLLVWLLVLHAHNEEKEALLLIRPSIAACDSAKVHPLQTELGDQLIRFLTALHSPGIHLSLDDLSGHNCSEATHQRARGEQLLT